MVLVACKHNQTCQRFFGEFLYFDGLLAPQGRWLSVGWNRWGVSHSWLKNSLTIVFIRAEETYKLWRNTRRYSQCFVNDVATIWGEKLNAHSQVPHSSCQILSRFVEFKIVFNCSGWQVTVEQWIHYHALKGKQCTVTYLGISTDSQMQIIQPQTGWWSWGKKMCTS